MQQASAQPTENDVHEAEALFRDYQALTEEIDRLKKRAHELYEKVKKDEETEHMARTLKKIVDISE